MKDRKTTSASHLAHAVCLTSLVACSSVPKSEPTEEERVILQEAMDVMDLVVELTEDVAELADPETLADARGGEGTVEEFQEGVRQAQDIAVRLWQDGRVLVFDTEDVLNPETSLLDDAGGFYGADADGAFIALERMYFTEYWGPAFLSEVLLHEGAHQRMSHTSKVAQEYARVNRGEIGEELRYEFEYALSKAAIESRDFPTELSDLCTPGTLTLLALDTGLSSVRFYLESKAEYGSWDEFNEYVEDYRKDGLGPQFTDIIEGNLWFANIELYSVDNDELLEIIRKSGLYEYAQERFLEQLEEIRRELREAYDAPPEASLEVQRGRGSRR